MLTRRQLDIFWLIYKNQSIGVSNLIDLLNSSISVPTLNRDLLVLKSNQLIITTGKGPITKYEANISALMTIPIPIDKYYEIEFDQRKILEKFNYEIFEKLKTIEIFSQKELALLNSLTQKYQKNTQIYSETEFRKEFERLTIELSWKSSQIEGNTYDLLDTEQLLKYNIFSKNNSKEEAIMLLNHKKAIEYTYLYKNEYSSVKPKDLYEIHSILTGELGITKGIRKRLVRITGTNYTPPDNFHIIEDYVNQMVDLINSKNSVFEKALLSILLISYIQSFEDGNKRTARIFGNALLMCENCCPLSYRSVSSVDYKKVILLFYELNNIHAFKNLFINQYQFAVENYF